MVLDKTIPHIGQFTKVPLNLFFLLGVCVLRWTPNEKPKLLHCIIVTSFVLHFSLDFTGLVSFLWFESLETSLEMTAYVIFSAYGGNCFAKLVCCFLNLDKLRQILQKLHSTYPKTIKEREDYKLDEHLKTIKRYNIGITIYDFSVTSMFNLFPLIQTIVVYYQSEKKLHLYALPFYVAYPFDYKTSFGYAFAYTTQCTATYTACCAFSGPDLLLITCVHLINMNLRYLIKCIRNFKPNGTLTDMEKLKSFITYHNHILECVEMVDSVFNILIFFHYMSTVTIICLIGFQLVSGTDFLDLIKFLSFLISALVHVYLISIFATEMTSLSSDVGDAFMHHPWYDAHISYRQVMVMPISRAQKPVTLNGLKFFIISMETFKSLVSVSYQFFTLINTSEEK